MFLLLLLFGLFNLDEFVMVLIDSFESLLLEFLLSFEVIWSTDVDILWFHLVLVFNMPIGPHFLIAENAEGQSMGHVAEAPVRVLRLIAQITV